MLKQKTPAELAHFVPEPIIILFGCRPLVPFHPGWHDRVSNDEHYRAPKSVRPGDRLWPAPRCPACKGRIGRRCPAGADLSFFTELDHRSYCELCGAMDPKNEANAMAQRIEEHSRERHTEATRQVGRTLKTASEKPERRPRLSESDRRRIWNGYKGGILSSNLEVTNRAKVGREFLIRIKQEPDWSLILDATGRVVGRYEAAPATLS